MRRSLQKEKRRILALLAHFITILTAAASPSLAYEHPIPADIPTSDILPDSSARPAEVLVVDGTAASPAPTLECSSADDKKFKFVLFTRRNVTGHWLADIDVQEDYTTGTTAPFEVEIEHRTHTCVNCVGGINHARISLTEPPPTRVPTGSGYRYFPGFGFYKRHLEEKSWYEARDVCKEEGADLVVINSEAEAKLLLELSAPLLYLKPAAKWNAEAYVGAYDFHEESDFITVDGFPLNESGYVHWSPGEPNNHREEDCVTIVRNAMFNDVQCTKTFEFICEVPE